MNLKEVWNLLKTAAAEWSKDNAPRLGAALSYYSIFALAPLLVIIIGVSGLVFGTELAQGYTIGQIKGLLGEQGGEALRTMVVSASQPQTGLVGSVLGAFMLLFGAAGLFGELQSTLNTVWGVETKSGRGVLGFIRDRFFSMTMVLGTAFLLMVSLVVSAAIAAIADMFGEWAIAFVGHVVHIAFDLTVITCLFATLFRLLPDRQIRWRDVWLGAAFTAILFSIGKLLIGLYLGHTAVGSAFGAAGSLAVLLVWLYYSSQIFLFGAEFTKVYAAKYGSRPAPSDNAVVTDEKSILDSSRRERALSWPSP